MGGSSSNDTGGGGVGGIDSGSSSATNNDTGVSGGDKEGFDRAMDNAERPDRAPAASADTTSRSDNDNDQRDTNRPDDRPGGSDKSETDEPDRAMDNTERPDRAPPSSSSPADTDNKPDEKDDPDDRDVTNGSDEKPDRAAGPPGVGAPPSSTAPAETANDSGDTENNRDDRSFIDRVADTLSAPPTDAQGNARSSSPVADRIGNHTQNYSVGDIKDIFAANDPPVTPEQSEALEEGAAVMEGVTTVPSRTPGTPTLDRIAAQRDLDLLGRPPSFEDSVPQIDVAAGPMAGPMLDMLGNQDIDVEMGVTTPYGGVNVIQEGSRKEGPSHRMEFTAPGGVGKIDEDGNVSLGGKTSGPISGTGAIRPDGMNSDVTTGGELSVPVAPAVDVSLKRDQTVKPDGQTVDRTGIGLSVGRGGYSIHTDMYHKDQSEPNKTPPETPTVDQASNEFVGAPIGDEALTAGRTRHEAEMEALDNRLDRERQAREEMRALDQRLW